MPEIKVAIIGSGPGGLMAAETLAKAGIKVTVYERNNNLGRKFLIAGGGGLNITHTGTIDDFMEKYGKGASILRKPVENFTPDNLRNWCHELGEETFIGTSGKIFPKSFKASPLLRAWREKLDKLGVEFEFNSFWTGWNDKGDLVFKSPEGTAKTVSPAATIMSLGGASWPKLGTDGSWVKIMEENGIEVSPLKPANCGFIKKWSEIFRERFAGEPLKPIAIEFKGKTAKGEAMITDNGLEGYALYILAASIRDEIEAKGSATINIDLKPDSKIEALAEALSKPRKSMTFSNFMHRATKLSPQSINLMREVLGAEVQNMPPEKLAKYIKSLPVKLESFCTLDKSISSAGGIKLSEIDENFMLKKKPMNFAIGEMLDWEAQTGGYLLQAAFSMGVYSAQKLIEILKNQSK